MANLCDWVIYTLAILFTFNFCIDYETAGCKGPTVRDFALKLILASSLIFISVLAMACRIISDHRLLAQPSHIFPFNSLLWNLHTHVQ